MAYKPVPASGKARLLLPLQVILVSLNLGQEKP